MGIKVFKFGGASISTLERVRKLADILKNYTGEKLLIVISAMGKTTNALEKVVEAFFNKRKAESLQLFQNIKNEHLELFAELTNQPVNQLTQSLNDFFTETEWLLHDKPVRNYDYYYDQVVPVGELLSTSIVSHYLNTAGIRNHWIDVRDIIRTDNNFRDANIDWHFTEEKVNEIIQPLFAVDDIVLTQGFIGATDENQNTTLGREGSDYTAAVFANLLNAESQTIWKDVQGVMNADPKLYERAEWIKELSYKEVIEMAYYGAQVIHPKTIKPLQNKNIPLFVKSFLHPAEEGTIIHNKNTAQLPPIIVYKEAQVLVQLSSKDFSFVGEGLTAKVKPNLTQNAAISLLIVMDDYGDKAEAFALQAAAFFNVQLMKKLTLLTIRHYNDEIFNELTGNCKIILKQQTLETVQVLMRIEN
ncbi:MAG: aspartate kinase [Chitinophagaceae bacterium]